MKYQLTKSKYVALKGGKCACKAGDVFDDGDIVDADAIVTLRMHNALVEYTPPAKATKEVKAAPIQKAQP